MENLKEYERCMIIYECAGVFLSLFLEVRKRVYIYIVSSKQQRNEYGDLRVSEIDKEREIQR